MVQKQAAFSSRLGGDSFADDDPLAELARIVGFESPVERDVAPTRAAEPQESPFNLEDELLREFEVFDAPLRGDAAPLAAEPVAAAPSPAPVDALEDLDDIFYPEPVVEPVAEAQMARVEPAIAAPSLESEPSFEPEQRAEPSFSADLADELELAVSEPPVTLDWPAPEAGPEPKLRLPLANFAAQPVARAEPQFAVEEDVEPAPHVAAEADASNVDKPSGVEDFFANEVFQWNETMSGPASAVPVAPAERPADPFGFDDLAGRSGEGHAVAAEAVQAAAPEARTEPSFSFSFADDLAANEDFSVSEPDVASAAPAERVAALQSEQNAELIADNRPSIEEEEFDPFTEGEFDLQLDDLELDLSDLEEDFDEPAGAPVVPVAAPARSLATPVASAPATSSVAPVPIAPVPAAAIPVAPRVAASDAGAAPAKPTPALPQVADEPLAFDPTEISEQDDHLESIAHMDVPEVPVPESKPAPVAYAHDYDLDIDNELAALFDQPSTTAAVSDKPSVAATPVSRATPSAPAPAPAAVPVQAAAAKATSLPPMDDFDAFERALEEDFRHTLDRPSDYAAANAGRIAIPMQPKGLSRFGSRGLLMAGTAAVAVLLGGGALYAWLSGGASSVISSGEPPVIAADKDPVKIVPENPGGKSVPNQDKAVYDRVAGATVEDPKQESLISSSEEPVDVVQKTLIPETLPLEGEAQALGTPVGDTEDPRLLPDQAGTEQAPGASTEPATITPRKVRTMIVRPDGTLVAQEAPEPAASAPTLEPPASDAAAAAPASATPALAAPSTTPATSDLAPPAASASPGPVPTARPASPAETAATEAAPAPVPEPVAAAPAAETAAPAPTPAAAAPEPVAAQPAPAAGSYFIQVASLPSEAEAEKSYRNVSTKFGSVVGGRAYEIKRAEIAGKGTYYRVRISAGTKAEAQALCERYKSAGGSCLVTK